MNYEANLCNKIRGANGDLPGVLAEHYSQALEMPHDIASLREDTSGLLENIL